MPIPGGMTWGWPITLLKKAYCCRGGRICHPKICWTQQDYPPRSAATLLQYNNYMSRNDVTALTAVIKTCVATLPMAAPKTRGSVGFRGGGSSEHAAEATKLIETETRNRSARSQEVKGRK